MRFFGSKLLLNLFFVFLLFYLTYHIFNGRYNIQNYLINKFELKLFQDFHYNLKQKSTAVDMDLKALYYEGEDFIDELSKQNSVPLPGETVLKLD
tara:strand:- start:367 stop:651 length:285 start_codon:yes stop_codon:yes gene_type:complete